MNFLTNVEINRWQIEFNQFESLVFEMSTHDTHCTHPKKGQRMCVREYVGHIHNYEIRMNVSVLC